MASTKIGVSLPEELVAFADEEAARRGISRSGLLASLLEAEQIREQTRQYLDKHGWDIAEDEQAWREYQRSDPVRQEKALRERLSLRGIARIFGVSLQTVLLLLQRLARSLLALRHSLIPARSLSIGA